METKTKLTVIKRNGNTANFDKNKIAVAIKKAMKNGSGIYEPEIADKIADEINEFAKVIKKPLTIQQIEDLVFSKLVENKQKVTAKSYEGYRAVQEFKRINNTIDESVLGLVNKTNKEVLNENSNKNATLVSTQRDLIAGEVSKDIARRKLLSADIVQAHDDGVLHLHDLDYILQPLTNCCVINLEDMLKNGTSVNGYKIEQPKSFQVACTVTTQIIANVSSSQFGGQSINGIDRILAPYVRKSHEKYIEALRKDNKELNLSMTEEDIDKMAWKRTKKEIKDGVQTIQYQLNTLMSSNGQSPFVSLLLYFDPESEYAKEAALITEEILKQRIDGLKNEKGISVTPVFPKLIYVLDEHNIHEDSEYYYLTKLSALCTSLRMYPDYISAKKMRENYDGNVFVPMG